MALIEKEATLEAKNDENWTALMMACRYGQEQVALALIEKEAALEAQNHQDMTALMFACQHGQEQAALALVKKGVDINCSNKLGQTTLMFAVSFNLKSVVRALLDKNVNTDDIWDYDDVRCTALGLARDSEDHEIIGMLEAKGALEIPPYDPTS